MSVLTASLCFSLAESTIYFLFSYFYLMCCKPPLPRMAITHTVLLNCLLESMRST